MKTGRFNPLVVVVVLGVVNCAFVSPPTEQMAVSRTAVEDAQRADAIEYAPVELRDAQAKLSKATEAMARDDNARARRLAEEAEVDARLAENKARTANARATAAELQEGLRLLRRALHLTTN
jgi:hypothetical protein